MRRETRRLIIGFGIALACWFAFVILLPRLECGPPVRLPRAVLMHLFNHARMVCSGDTILGSHDSLLLNRLTELRDQDNQYYVVRFPASSGRVGVVAAYPLKRKAYRSNLFERLATWDWEIQSQYSYVLTAGGELYNSFSFDAQNPVTEWNLPLNQPGAWTFVRLVSVLPPCS